MNSKEELSVTVNGIPVDYGIPTHQAGDVLRAWVSNEAYSTYGGLHVVKTPLSEYVPDHEAIKARDGEILDLGDIPTLVAGNVQQAEFHLGEDEIWSIFYLQRGSMLDNKRVITRLEGESHWRLTLDEIKMMVAFHAGFRPEDLRGTNAQVIYDGLHLYNRQQFLHYGLRIGGIVATITNNDPFRLLLVHADRNRFFDRVTPQMLTDELNKQK